MKVPENIRYIITLSLICFITAALLSLVYYVTQPRILAQREKAENEALQEVLPQAGYFEPVEKDGRILYFQAYASADKKRLLGYAFKAQGQGYSGVIESIAGMDPKGRITGVRVLAQNETPGLGARVDEVLVTQTLWQAIKGLFTAPQAARALPGEPWFCAQFKGKDIAELTVSTAKGGQGIQAITGATISSQALTDSLREKAQEVLQYGP